MKSSFKFILVALAVTAALVACTKEITPPNFENDKVNPAAEGSRVIAVSFAPQPQTKTTLEGFQPKFVNGKDTILLVSYPENSDPVTDTCVVTVDDNTGKATISTDLTGDLMALYPAKYAKQMPNEKFGLPVPAVQSGKFADANFCGTQIKDGEESAIFQNYTALFIISAPTGTKRLTVKSLKQIGADGQRTGDMIPISMDENLDWQYTISVNESNEDNKYYVSLNYGANLIDLSFEVEYETSGTGSIKGIPMRTIADQAAATGIEDYESIQPGTAYTIDGSNWHEYVTVAGRKWATMNVGASKPEDAGEYFMWGGTTGYVHSAVDNEWFSYPTPPDSVLFENGFCWQNCPYTEGVYTGENKNVFTKYTGYSVDYAYSGTADEKFILDLSDDAANVKWGGAWRMPTRDEFNNMAIHRQGVFNSGLYFGDESPTIFLPAAGSGNGKSFSSDNLRYWSSFLTNDPDCAYSSLYDYTQDEFTSADPSPRYYGFTIRAIIDDPVDGDQEDAPQE